MQLLDVRTPSLTRIQYANKKSEEVWSKKIANASRVYSQLEFNTVKHGVRPCMLLHNFNPADLDTTMRSLAKQGMLLVPLEKESSDGGGFSHTMKSYDGNGNFTYRAVVARNIKDAHEFIHAHESRDDISIGRLLGFPECCSKFFDEAWKAGYFDPIWQQAQNNQSNVKVNKEFEDRKLIRLKQNGDFYKTLAVFRYIGIRFISHFACSFECQHSLEIANKWIDLARELRLPGVDDALEIMQLPFEWDCYKGYAVVNTPVLKIVTSSMPCYPKHVIQQESDLYPEEAPTGIQFPWRFFKGKEET